MALDTTSVGSRHRELHGWGCRVYSVAVQPVRRSALRRWRQIVRDDEALEASDFVLGEDQAKALVGILAVQSQVPEKSPGPPSEDSKRNWGRIRHAPYSVTML